MRIHTCEIEGASEQEALRREGDEAAEDSEGTVPRRYSTDGTGRRYEDANERKSCDGDVPTEFSSAELPPRHGLVGGSSSLAVKAVGERREGASQEWWSRPLRHDLRGAWKDEGPGTRQSEAWPARKLQEG